MASESTSLNVCLDRHIKTTSTNIQKLVSARAIPLWINPNNSNYYTANPYKAGDIVILLSDENQIYYLLRHYLENIASNIGVNSTFFVEKNNPEIDDSIIDVLINGGYLPGFDDKYINPMTIVSSSEKGYGLYVSLKNQNYDIPGASDSWFNLDMSESIESVQLQISRIVSILTSEGYIDKLSGECLDPETEEKYNANFRYIDNRMDMHNKYYHFGEQWFYGQKDESAKAFDKLEEIQEEIESHVNTTTSIMRNPFILNNEIVGNMTTVIQTTGQMFFYCMLDATKITRDKNITIQFTPNNESNIIVPIVLKSDGEIITVDNPKTDDYVLIENNIPAWYVNSYVKISNDTNHTNSITIETNRGYEEANFNNNFIGFLDDAYIATYTPIGAEVRANNISIHCSPVKEISRTNKSITIQLSSEYVWKYTALAIAISGKCEVIS